MFEHWVDRYVKNWAHCDGVSTWLLAACIANQPALADRLVELDKIEKSLEAPLGRCLAGVGSAARAKHRR